MTMANRMSQFDHFMTRMNETSEKFATPFVPPEWWLLLCGYCGLPTVSALKDYMILP